MKVKDLLAALDGVDPEKDITFDEGSPYGGPSSIEVREFDVRIECDGLVWARSDD